MVKKILIIILLILAAFSALAAYNTITYQSIKKNYELKGNIATINLNSGANDVQIKAGKQNRVQIVKNKSNFIEPNLNRGNLDFTQKHHFNFMQLIRFGGSSSNILITLKKPELKALDLTNAAGDSTISGINIHSGDIHTSAGDINIYNSKLNSMTVKNSAGDLNVNDSTLGAYDSFHGSAGDHTFTNSKFQYGYSLSSTAGDDNADQRPNHFDSTKGTKITNSAGDNTVQ